MSKQGGTKNAQVEIAVLTKSCKELSAQLAASEAAACRMREALSPFSKAAVTSTAFNAYAKERGDKALPQSYVTANDFTAAYRALAASSPCPHEAEVKRMRVAISSFLSGLAPCDRGSVCLRKDVDELESALAEGREA